MSDPVLSDAELDDMRSFAVALLPDTAVLLRSAGASSDGMGGSVESAPVASSLVCRVGASSLASIQHGERLLSTAVWPITFPANTVLHVTDQLRVTSATYGTMTFEVQRIGRRSTWEVQQKVYCVQVGDYAG